MPKKMRMYSMPVLACFVLTFDLLQISPSSYVIEDVLNLPCGDMTISIARKQPAFGSSGKLFL
jgi:hypothetical protein